jgi:RecJ-like exonuclease
MDILNDSGNHMLTNKDQGTELCCPKCKSTDLDEDTQCATCCRTTPSAVCPVCGDKTVKWNICLECDHEWTD